MSTPYQRSVLTLFLCSGFLLLTLASPFTLAQAICSAATPSITLDLQGEITRADFETYIEKPFEVPANVSRIDIAFEYDRGERTTIDIGLLDTRGFRGWSGGNKTHFFVSRYASTPSYTAGPIEAGTWKLLLGVPNIREAVVASYTATVTLHCNTPPREERLPSDRGQAWYVGDLHAHSAHSDGSCSNSFDSSVPCPAALSVQVAAERGLDFFALTEHNAVSHYAAIAELQPFTPNTLLLAGREVTTFYGHANVFGTTEFIDFRLQQNADFGIVELQQRAEKLGALLSINHPGSPSGEDCMGCGWVLPATDYALVGAIEVVNTGFVDMPRGRAHRDFWHEKLNLGYRLTGIAGSDNHTATRPLSQPSAIGNPRTWVFADSLSEAALLAGIRRGNVFIDTTAGMNRLLEFSASGRTMGEEISLSSLTGAARALALTLRWDSNEALTPRWTVDGVVVGGDAEAPEFVVGALVTTSDNTTAWAGELTLAIDSAPRWLRMDLVNTRGATRLIGNPVYLTP